jgi:hypothetical protein
MQICQDHWHELKNAIRQRGMWKLVSPDQVQPLPAHITKRVLSSPTTQWRLDPLTTATLMIYGQALMALGSYLETCDYCPLCEVEVNLGQGLSFEWIDVDADAVLELCRERNLIRSE